MLLVVDNSRRPSSRDGERGELYYLMGEVTSFKLLAFQMCISRTENKILIEVD